MFYLASEKTADSNYSVLVVCPIRSFHYIFFPQCTNSGQFCSKGQKLQWLIPSIIGVSGDAKPPALSVNFTTDREAGKDTEPEDSGQVQSPGELECFFSSSLIQLGAVLVSGLSLHIAAATRWLSSSAGTSSNPSGSNWQKSSLSMYQLNILIFMEKKIQMHDEDRVPGGLV